MTRGVFLRGLVALTVTWSLVFAVTLWSGAKKVTPETVAENLALDDFADWSGKRSDEMDPKEREERQKYLDEFLTMVDSLDLREIGEVFANENYWTLGARLADDEGQYLIERMMGDHGSRMLEMFDQLDPEVREEMMRRTLRKLESGEGSENLARLKEENPELVDQFIRLGGKKFFKESSMKTKLALLPFLSSIQESLQGFGKPDFGGL